MERMCAVLKRAYISIATAIMMVVGGISVVNAVTVDVDGGTWDYGTSSSMVWSNYLHQSAQHRSAVIGTYRSDSACMLPGWWARASAEKVWFQAAQSYYDFC
jgi:bacteriocin, lactococcin 972 family